MALPSDSPHPAGANASAFAGARLTPEDAERLAANFRPSWELDDLPFSGASPLTEADIRAMKGGGTLADVRGAVRALNGTHAPAPATVLQEEPTSSVIIDGEEAAPAVPRRPIETARVSTPPAAGATSVVASHAQAHTLPQRTLVMANAPRFARPAKRGLPPSVTLARAHVGKRAGLWIGLGAAAVVVLGVAFWLASRSEQKPEQAVPSVAADTAEATAQSQIPTAPAETISAQPTQSAKSIPSAESAQSVPPAPRAPPPAVPQPAAVAVAPPVAPPIPPGVVSPAPRPPIWIPVPPAKPVSKPKAGPTIVRDVPF
jgi:hypothetical protein